MSMTSVFGHVTFNRATYFVSHMLPFFMPPMSGKMMAMPIYIGYIVFVIIVMIPYPKINRKIKLSIVLLTPLFSEIFDTLRLL